jgi:20S proteasome alpha/beta subunit
MTIAAGFVCTDGILLASDTLYSSEARRYGRKLWILDHGDVLVVFGGAGLGAGLRRTRDEIERKLKPGLSRAHIVDIIDTAITKVHAKLSLVPESKISVLVVIRTGDESILYENAELDMLSTVDHSYQCVGSGDGLGRYFASSLFRPGMSIRWAKIVAAHMIKKCKDHVAYCGGDTHLVEIPSLGAATFVDDQAQIQTYEQHLAEIDDAMRIVLPDNRANDDTLEYRLGTLNEAIRKARNTFVTTGLIQLNAEVAIDFSLEKSGGATD